jgi:hypothetical protein
MWTRNGSHYTTRLWPVYQAHLSERSDTEVGLEDTTYKSPLVTAAQQGYIEIVKILLGHLHAKLNAHCLDMQDVVSGKYFEERKKRSLSVP